jgi:3-deoxy-D-manno-octulosonic-acid transferase
VDLVRKAADVRPVIVAGSTVEVRGVLEEAVVLAAWQRTFGTKLDPLLVLAPRHPERFKSVEAIAAAYPYVRASDSLPVPKGNGYLDIVLLDTIGDLASVYAIADIAIVGGSLLPRGGHNPLEPAQFSVPVVMGPSYENFRDVVEHMQAADAIIIAKDEDVLVRELVRLLNDREAARAMGERGRKVYEEQQGATKRTVDVIVGMVKR